MKSGVTGLPLNFWQRVSKERQTLSTEYFGSIKAPGRA
jgi:hypothetical protein